QRHRVFGKMGFQRIQPAVGVEIADRDTHASLLVAVLVHGQTGLQALLRKSAVSAVVEEQARSRVARHVDVLPSVAVQILRHYGQAKLGCRRTTTGARPDVREGSVSRALVAHWTVRD